MILAVSRQVDGAFAATPHARLGRLDGLRAVAILMVIAQHTGLLRVGWAGVHLFFVLSGFLITGILRRAREDRHFWGPFYLRRATRILPPLAVFLVYCGVVGLLHWRGTGWAYVFFGANVVASTPHAEFSDATVLWSLAVEEHFYFVWPFAVRYLRREVLVRLLIGILVLEPVVRWVATYFIARWQPIYFLTPFQLDGLAAGSLLALLLEREVWVTRLRRWAGWMALGSAAVYAGMSLVPGWVREWNTPSYNGLGYSLLVLTSVFVLARVYLRPRSLDSLVLGTPPMVFVGAISYGLYLYNGPVMHAVIDGLQGTGFRRGRVILLVALVAAVVVAWVSFRFYETPVVRWGRRRAGELAEAGRGSDESASLHSATTGGA